MGGVPAVLRSPDKEAWTDCLVSEVQKLEDARTWVRVPRSEAVKAGKPVHIPTLPAAALHSVEAAKRSHSAWRTRCLSLRAARPRRT